MVSSRATTVTFQVRYAAASARSMTVTLREANASQIESFASTGSDTTFSTRTFTFNLIKGVNTVRFTSRDSVGGPNIDRVRATML